MGQTKQYDYNSVADYYYKLQRDETSHQSNRMTWIIAAQALVFAGICTLAYSTTILPNNIPIDQFCNMLICILVIVGVLTSISAVYSIFNSYFTIGSILDEWNDYDSLKVDQKPNPIAHKVIAAPNAVLNSGFSWLTLSSFVPKVFASAWILLFLSFIVTPEIKSAPIYILVYFTIILISVHCVVYFYMKHKKTQVKLDLISDKVKKKCNQNNNEAISNEETNNVCNYFNVGSMALRDNSRDDSCISFNLSIYQILIDRFNGNWTVPPKSVNDFLGGNIKGIIEKLYYIKNMGYNAIMLSPIYETRAYHGYHITNYEKVNPSFGDWNDFRSLICKAHKIGIKVICDFVPNHCHKAHPFFKNALGSGDKRDWFTINSKTDYSTFGKHLELPKFNHKNQETSQYFINRAIELARLGIDGLRIDHAVGVPLTFLLELRNAVKLINKNFIVVGEVLPVGAKDTNSIYVKDEVRRKQMECNICDQDDLQLDYIGTLDAVLDYAYRDIILNELESGGEIDVDNVHLRLKLQSHFSKYSNKFFPIIFLDNHDVDRIMFVCKRNKSIVEKLIVFTKSLGVPYSIYYGTEQYMCNQISLKTGVPYADLGVREAMNW